MRLPRITVRRLMVAVALVALGVGFERLWSRRQFFLREAAGRRATRAWLLKTSENVAYWEMRWTDQRSGMPAQYPWPAGPPFVPAIARYHEAMAEKYERAARYPWLPVEPDPPEPR